MWFITAWQRISAQLILEGFKKRCICIVVDRNDDAIPWNGSEEELKFRSECEVDEGTDCFNNINTNSAECGSSIINLTTFT